MRIGQLARKIGVQPSLIISFLQKEELYKHGEYNTKINEKIISQIKNHFEYVQLDATPSEQPTKDQTDQTDPTPPENIQESEQSIETRHAYTIDKTSPSDEGDSTEETHHQTPYESTPQDDVIRAPKVKLEGIKVLGKIVLPAPKEKVSKEQEKLSTVEKSNTINQKNTKRTNNNYKEKKKTLTLEQKLENEQKEYNNKKKLKFDKEKKERTKRYESMMLNRQSFEPKKKKSRPAKRENNYLEAKYADKPAPTTLFGKFIRWLNT